MSEIPLPFERSKSENYFTTNVLFGQETIKIRWEVRTTYLGTSQRDLMESYKRDIPNEDFKRSPFSLLDVVQCFSVSRRNKITQTERSR